MVLWSETETLHVEVTVTHRCEPKKLDEIIAAKPSAEYDERWGKGFIPTGRFIEMLMSAWAK